MTSTAPTVRTTYAVTGMTCGCCEGKVSRAVGALEGVTAVDVQRDAGRVTVTGTAAPDDNAVAAALTEAGFELTGRA
ncbi:heavy-metal-associated domain-containing protein [Streptomyces sp. NPDC048182]|uniref:heavy-metal-associated domain-containing protein n=1 Tax=unclassified Streptomyces TaxID=2593676 RepID=UPI0033B4D689